MKIDPNARYVEYLLLLENADKESMDRLQEDAESHLGSPWSLALRDFFALSSGDLSFIGLDAKNAINATVRQYVWMKAFKEVVEHVANLLQQLRVPQSADAQKASQQCLKMDVQEAALVFVRKYFGLKSFTEAENVTLADYIIAKKDEYNTAMFQYAMSDLQRQKFKHK